MRELVMEMEKHSRKSRTNQRHCEMAACCGKTFPAGMLPKHQAGFLHRSTDIRKMLETKRFSLEEIGAHLGISRERVRQVAVHFGYSDRKGVKSLSLTAMRERAQTNPILRSFIEACARESIPVDLVQSDKYRGFLVKYIVVNGHTVTLRRSSFRATGYCTIHGRRKQVSDFFAYLLPDNRWLILPWGAVPPNQTMFGLEVEIDGRGYTRDNRHDYPKFIEAWELFRTAAAEE